MNLSQACLTDDQLRRLACNEMPPSEVEDLEDHVDVCKRCRDVLTSVHSNVAWHEELAAALKEPLEGLSPSDVNPIESDSDSLPSMLKLLGPTDDPRMLGRIGTYEVVGIIGRGGMGVVFKAFDGPLNRFVAIKMLLPHLAASGAARRRFAREGQAAAAVINDHVLPIYGVAEWQGVPYLVTQYSRSTTLQKRIEQHGPLQLKEILRIGMQTANGLAAAHAQGLVHRDVKPSNILLDETVERAMLTDFGLARAVDDATLTRSGIIAGTPGYMSPEQTRGDAIDHRSDLFSLGSVLYTLSTGHPPFRADTTFGIMHRIREDIPRPIREINPDLPLWFQTIIFKLLEKKAEDRFASSSDLAETLKQCLAHVQQPLTTSLPESVAVLQSESVPSIAFNAEAAIPSDGKRGSFRRLRKVALLTLSGVSLGLVLVAILQSRHEPAVDPIVSQPRVEHAPAVPTGQEHNEAILDWNDRQIQLDDAARFVDILEANVRQDMTDASSEQAGSAAEGKGHQ